MTLSALQWGIAVATVLAAGAGAVAYARWRRSAAERARLAPLHAAGAELVRNVLLPDAAGGEIHCDFLLLTRRGLLVVDFRDVTGVVFGGRHMDEWTVMDGNLRSTFANPIEPLLDRMAAVKLLAGDAPVEGRVVFTGRAEFPKGLPPQVVMLRELGGDFPAVAAQPEEAERWREAWNAVRAAARPSTLGRR